MDEILFVLGISLFLAAVAASMIAVTACMMSSRISREDGE